MAFSRGPNSITNGLVLSLDMANSKSFSSLDNSWKDLSSQGNNGTFINQPTYDSGNLGSVVLDGTNDYISTPLSIIDNNPYTLSVVFKINSFTGTDMRIMGALSGSTQQLTVGWIGSNLRLWLDSSWNSTNFTSQVGVIYHLTIVHQDLDTSVYVNGVHNSTITGKSSYFEDFGFGQPFVFCCGQYFSGHIYLSQIYNRSLTSDEVLNNFNSIKTRFEL